MKRNLIIGMMALAISLGVVACKKDSNDPTPTPGNPGNPGTPKAKNVKYTLTGNYTGELSLTYFQSNGGVGTNPPATSLPWEKEITYESGVQGISFTASGNTGQPGQTVTAKVYVNGTEVKTATGIADDRGIVVVSPGTHVF